MKTLNKTLFVIGFMGAGKSSVSAGLSRALNVPTVEMDAEIVRREGMPITEIFARKGEEYFRACETALLKELGEGAPCIVSCGGGVAMREQNRKLMREIGTVLLLTAAPETILARVKDSTERPLLNGHMDVDYITGLMSARRPNYEAAATLIVDTSPRTVAEVCEEVLKRL